MAGKRFFYILSKALVLPTVAVYLTNQFDLFAWIKQLQPGKSFDFSVAAYMAIAEATVFLLEDLYRQSSAKVDIIFYKHRDEENESNYPVVKIKKSNGVASIRCAIRLRGKPEKLRKLKVIMRFPEWVSSQGIFPYSTFENNELIIDFNSIIPQGSSEHNTNQDFQVPLTINIADGYLETSIVPEFQKCGPFKVFKPFLAKIESKGFRIKVS